MKKYFYVTFAAILTITLCSCSKKAPKFDASQIKRICELATVECYYNNLAMTTVEKDDGISHWFEKDREFWLEYEGVVKIGIDMEDVSIKAGKDKITVTMPHAKVFGGDFKYETLEAPNIIQNKDSWINKNKITSEDQIKAINDAQTEMIKSMNSNKSLMNRAEDRAKLLIENYIDEISDLSGVEYEIVWKYIEEDE